MTSPQRFSIITAKRMAPMEVMPIEMRLDVTPNSFVPKLSDTTSNNICSVSPSGATISAALISGTGSCRMSIFPLGVIGIASNCTRAVGTMYEVSDVARNALISSESSFVSAQK